MKKILRFLISRVFWFSLLIVVQIGIFAVILFNISSYSTYLYAAFVLFSLIIVIWLVAKDDNPSYKITWIILIMTLPVVGWFFYLKFGNKTLPHRYWEKIAANEAAHPALFTAEEGDTAALLEQYPRHRVLTDYIRNISGFPAYGGTQVEYAPLGEDFFRQLMLELPKAKKFIFLEYFILEKGLMWDSVLEILRERAAAGVEVKIIFDDFGNITRLSDPMLQAIQNCGIELEVFNPVHKYVNRLYFNYRDHRKITVIDGHWAYTGGINIGDEYANRIRRFGHWKDSGVRIEGDAAWSFTLQFIRMWRMIGGEMPNELDYYRPRTEPPAGEGYCQPFCDGPENNPDNPVLETYLQIIGQARRMLYLTTPYYAVEASMQEALCIAADAGVDVRLMMPGIPDKKMPYMVAETYWGELLRHGVKIYRYTPGFLHSKSVLADRELALVGSTNMDYRTFQLQYETAVLLYQSPAVEELLEDMDAIMAESQPYTLAEWNRRPWPKRAIAAVLKLFSIWL